jgi:peptide/nickel transport system permease protein
VADGIPLAIPAATSPAETVERLHGRQSRLARIAGAADLWLPGGFLALIVLTCFVFPLFGTLPDPTAANPLAANLPLFTPGHLLGTDPIGFDVFSRLIHGGRLSIEVGLGAALIGLLTGGTAGVVAGYYGGRIDAVVSRILDIFLAFPSLVLAMTIATYLGQSVINVIWAISFFSIPAFARLARASTQRLREQTFITAARLCGTRSGRLIVGHIVPNVLPELITYALLSVAHAVLIEASLSFLGLGVRPPAPSWGTMIAIGQQNIYTNQSLLLIPSLALLFTMMSLNVLGDALRARWVAR